MEIVAKGPWRPRVPNRAKAPDPSQPRLEVRARDEAGAPVKDFEIQLYGPPGPSPSAIGVDGLAVVTASALNGHPPFGGWNHGDLIVSAAGFASSIAEFGAVQGLRKVDVVLKRGRKVRLRVRDSAGKPVPPALMPLPQVYLSRHRRDAWSTLAYKDPETRAQAVGSTNFLDVRPEPGGDFAFRIQADQPGSLYFGFSHPDVLRYYEKGPVTASDLAGGVWDVVLPQAATVDVSLKSPVDSDGKSPFANAYFSLTPIIAGQADAVPGLDSVTLKAPEWQTTLNRLAPGSYNVHVQTVPRGGPPARPDLQARAGQYHDARKLDLKPGEHASVVFDPSPFDPDAWRGKLAATVIISPAGDRSLAGEDYQVSYVLANFGYLPVAKGKLSADGKITLENIAPSGTNPFGGQYQVEVAGEHLGLFRVKDAPARQEFPLRMPVRAGDLAAVAETQNVETGQPVRIADFRGKVVFLEFWATWCGPCREPMDHLIALAKRRADAWKKDVALVAVSIDNDRENLRRHIGQNGLTSIQHLWSPQDHSEQPGSAYAAYSINGVPTAFLIGRDGRIIWRGHPASLDLEPKIESLVAGGH